MDEQAAGMAPSHSLRLLAPAKINLHLRVGPLGADGFHPLLSWMVRVGLFDTLTLATGTLATGTLATGTLAAGDPVGSPASPGEWVRLVCDDAALPCDAGNLVVRAGEALAAALGKGAAREGGDALIRVSAALQKRIPMGAGLGGGSSDGASALRGLSRLWRVGWGRAALADLSLRLGSDLPFFFFGPSSICTGRGEFVRPTPPPVCRWALLALPAIHLPTPAVYREFDRLGLGDQARLAREPDWKAWAAMPAGKILPNLVNDLEAPAFVICPELDRLRVQIEAFVGRPVRMSGSGSSLFTLYDGQAEAVAAAERVADRFSVRAMGVEIAPALVDDAADDEAAR